MRAKRLLTPVLCLLVLSGCASEEDAFLPENAGDVVDDVVPCPSSVPETTIGMMADGVGNTLRAELIEAEDLPAKKGLNHWVIRFTAADGEALDDVELTADDVAGKMQGHTHGLNRDPAVESLGDGTVDISEINLFMDGHWYLTFSPTSESLGSDQITFELCTAASIAATEDE
jgi:hypothetical protein